MNYDQIDVLDKGTVWQGGAVDAAIDSPPFAGPLLVVCMDRGEDNDQFINHATVEAVLAVWIDDVPTGYLKDGVLTGLADAIVAWLNDDGNVYLHCHQGVSRASYIDIAVHCRALGISANDALARIKAQRPIADPNPGFLAQLQRLWP
jgi:protein-tyrosine phosphatase